MSAVYPPIKNKTIECPACGRIFMAGEKACGSCNWENPYFGKTLQEIESIQEMGNIDQAAAEERYVLEAIKTRGQDGVNKELSGEVLERLSANVPLTTALDFVAREIEKEVEVISAECVFGVNIFRDVFSEIRDVVGGRSNSLQKVLRGARKTALAELKKEAVLVGADAVIGVKLDYEELSGSRLGNMLMVVASGTAVKLCG